jgi:hypothetical protein
MLTAIYTSDIKGDIVVPFVDETRDAVLSLLERADPATKVYVWRWMRHLLPISSHIVLVDDQPPNWFEVAADNTQHYVFFDEVVADAVTSFCEIVLDDDEVLGSGIRGPAVDMNTMVLETVPLTNGCRLQHWTRLTDDIFEAVDVDFGIM